MQTVRNQRIWWISQERITGVGSQYLHFNTETLAIGRDYVYEAKSFLHKDKKRIGVDKLERLSSMP